MAARLILDKYRFIEAGLNMLIRRLYNTPSWDLLRAIGVYEQTSEETGSVEDLVRFRGNGAGQIYRSACPPVSMQEIQQGQEMACHYRINLREICRIL